MARKPALAPVLNRQHPAAPVELPSEGQALWDAIVRNYDPEHFAPADQTLLAEFVRCRLIVSSCNDTIANEGLFQHTPAGQKPSAAVLIRDTQLKNLAMLAGKLRLPVSSRIRSESAVTRPWNHELDSNLAAEFFP